MKLVLKLLGLLAALVVVLLLVAFAFPRKWRVERSVVLQAPPEKIIGQIADLRAWKAWGIWQERDPGMKVSYSDPATGVGAWSQWISAKEGTGRMAITEQTSTLVAYALEFPDFGMKSTASLTLKSEGKGTRVVWQNEGDLGLNLMNRWFGLFLDGLIGADFEKSLAKLKRIVEA